MLRGVRFSAAAAAELRRLASAAYPQEGCGVLVGSAGEVATVVSVTAGANLAPRTRDRYELDPLEILRAEREARAAGLEVLGFWHSHPDHPAVPSRFDTERAWPDYLYVIASTTAEGTGDVRGWSLGGEGDGAAFGEVTVAEGASPLAPPAAAGDR
jgi:proteasome lid subunit RPN8/RPN11